MDARCTDPGRSLKRCLTASVALLAAIVLAAPAARADAPAPPGGTLASTVVTDTTPEAIPDFPSNVDDPRESLTHDFVVSGAGTYLASLDLRTEILHTFPGDLTVTLTSPEGTTVTVVDRQGGGNDNVFGNTLWSDNASPAATEAVYANDDIQYTLSPQQAFARFYGEDPNGTWRLTITDNSADDTGSLNAADLILGTLDVSPTVTEQGTYTNNQPKTISPGVQTSQITVSGIPKGTVWDTKLTTLIDTSRRGTLKLTLTDPAGHTILIDQENGVTSPDTNRPFYGTVWDDGSSTPVTTAPFNGTQTSLAPEQPLAAFRGDDPNGTWILSYSGTFGVNDAFFLDSWSLDISTATVPTPPAAPAICGTTTKQFTFSPNLAIPQNTGTPPDMTDGAVSTAGTVSGMGPSLFDVQVRTSVVDPSPSHLRMLLVAPNGQRIWLARNRATQIGAGDRSHTFDGTLWDDAAGATAPPGAVAESILPIGGVSTPLAPMQPLSALVGVNPNGQWALRLVDVGTGASVSTLTGWSLLLTSATQTPVSTKNIVSSSPNASLPAGATTSSPIDVAGAGTTLNDLNVNVAASIQAKNAQITLTSPAGTVVTLATNTGSAWGTSTSTFSSTVFDDSAFTSVSGQAASDADTAPDMSASPTTLSPTEPLGAFRGEDPNGTWTLTITNNGPTAASLSSWGLTARTITCSDKTPPVNPTLSSPTHAVSTPSTSNVITADFSGATDSSSGVAGYSYVFDSSPSTTPDTVQDAGADATSATSSAQPDGNVYFHLRTVDAAGNWSDPVTIGPFVVDTAGPDTAIASGPTGLTGLTRPTFTFTATATATPVTYECALDLGAYAPCTTPYQPATALSPGAHTLSVRATDMLSLTDATPATRSFTVDTTFPDTTIDSGPGGLTTSPVAVWTFSSTKASSTFACTLDGATSPCTSPYTSTTLGSGNHTFSVAATDPAGNTDITPASRTINVDVTAPETSFSSGPSGPTRVTGPSFGLAADDDAVTYECRIGSGAFAPCTSPYTVGPLAEGTYTVQARATDAAGNTDQTPASRTFTVDTTAPDTTISSGPTGTATTATPTFAFTSTETGSTFACSLDSTTAYSPCTSPLTLPDAVTDGTHTLRVRATDAAGNTDATPATMVFVVDTTAPDTTLGAAPTGMTGPSPAFTFSSSDVTATFECSVDGTASFSACTSPTTLGPLAGGAHTLYVRAVDPAGNADQTPATRAFTVDATPPETTLGTAPSGAIATATPAFAFSSDDGAATFECSIDSTTAYSPCVTPYTAATLADGPHTFRVRARDAVGNVDATPASATFTVDTTAPDTTITTGLPALITDPAPSVEFTSTEAGSTFECRVDSAAYAACTSPYVAPTLSDGRHTINVRATDAVGNVDTTPAARSFTVDTTPPDTTITGGPTTASGPSMTFAFTAGEAGATYRCSLDRAVFTTCVSPVSYTGLADGPHTFAVEATDAAGNDELAPVTRTVAVDGVLPVAWIVSGPADGGFTPLAQPVFGFASSKDGSSFLCAVDDNPFGSCAATFTTRTLADGPHSISVKATDALGNAGTAADTRVFTVDTVAPDTAITVAPPASTVITLPVFSFVATEAGSTFECALDDGAYSACAPPFTTPALAVGAHRFLVRAVDRAGNHDPSPATYAVTVVAPPAPPPAAAATLPATTPGAPAVPGAAAPSLSDADRSIALVSPAKKAGAPTLRIGIAPVTLTTKAATIALVCPVTEKRCTGAVTLTPQGTAATRGLKLSSWTGKLRSDRMLVVRWKLSAKGITAVTGLRSVKIRARVRLARANGRSTTATRTFTVPVVAAP